MVEFLTGNFGQIVVVISLALNLASAVAALTVTKKDDAVIAKVKSFLGRFLSIK